MWPDDYCWGWGYYGFGRVEYSGLALRDQLNPHAPWTLAPPPIAPRRLLRVHIEHARRCCVRTPSRVHRGRPKR